MESSTWQFFSNFIYLVPHRPHAGGVIGVVSKSMPRISLGTLLESYLSVHLEWFDTAQSGQIEDVFGRQGHAPLLSYLPEAHGR